MTHELDPVIGWLENFERDRETWEASGMNPEPFCRALRILRSKRDETSFGKPVLERLEEAREEGRKKELERVVGIIRSMGEQACVSMISPFRSDSYVEHINERVEAFHQVIRAITENREGSAQGHKPS